MTWRQVLSGTIIWCQRQNKLEITDKIESSQADARTKGQVKVYRLSFMIDRLFHKFGAIVWPSSRRNQSSSCHNTDGIWIHGLLATLSTCSAVFSYPKFCVHHLRTKKIAENSESDWSWYLHRLPTLAIVFGQGVGLGGKHIAWPDCPCMVGDKRKYASMHVTIDLI